MQTTYLGYFVDIVEQGTISAAANKNFISTQGMSRALSVLEAGLGCQLFKRHQNKLLLTAYGEALYHDALRIVSVEQHMVDAIAAIRQKEDRAVDKTALLYLNNVAFDAALFAPITDSFEHLFSDARYFQCDNKGVADALVSNKEDDNAVVLGLLCLFSPDDAANTSLVEHLRENGFEYQPYLTSYDQVLVSRQSALAGKHALSHADIKSRPIVSSDGDIRRVAELLFGKDSIYMVTADSSFRFHMVERDEAITFVPAFRQLITPDDGKTVAINMKNPYYLEVGFVAKREVLDSPVIQKLFARLNACYMKYSHTPYLSLVDSAVTAFALSCDESLMAKGNNVEAFCSRYGLSSREAEVLALLLEGLTSHPIAELLHVSVSTAKSHIYNIYKKMGLHTQGELIALAEEFMS